MKNKKTLEESAVNIALNDTFLNNRYRGKNDAGIMIHFAYSIREECEDFEADELEYFIEQRIIDFLKRFLLQQPFKVHVEVHANFKTDNFMIYTYLKI